MPSRLLRFWPALVLACFYVLVAHLSYSPPPDKGFELERPRPTSGDEPHYLIAINSLLFDHDVRVDPDFARIAAGGFEAGAERRGFAYGGHSILVDPATGAHTLCIFPCKDEDAAKVGAPLDRLVQYPAHPVGYPAFMAALAWPLRPSIEEAEPLVGTLTLLVSFAGVLLTYLAARRSGLSTKHSLAAAALLGLASAWLPYARSYFAEPSIGLFLLIGYVALRSDRPLVAGLAIGIATTMKQPFVLFAAAWFGGMVLARRWRSASLLGAGTGLFVAAQLAFNFALLHQATTTGSLGFAWAHGLRTLRDTLFQPIHGLLVFVPWAAPALIWGPIALGPGLARRARRARRAGALETEARRQIVVPVMLCFATFASVAWGPGRCYGPRYWVPLLPFLAMLAVDFALSGRRWRKALTIALAVVGGAIAIPSAIAYHRLYSAPPTRLLEPDPPPPTGRTA